MTQKHSRLCECKICEAQRQGKSHQEGMAEYRKWEHKQMEKYGWYSHYVPPDTAGLANIHTHGIQESFGHPDLQIVVSLAPNLVSSIFANIVERIKAGEKFVAAEKVSKIITDFDITFADAIENDRWVLRIILPDAEGNLELGKIKGLLARQYEGTLPLVVVN